MALKWLVYYDDETHISSDDTTIENLECSGVVFVVMEDPDSGRQVLIGDYYVYDNLSGEGWRFYPCDLFGLFDYLIRPGLKKVLFGRWVGSCLWNKLYNASEANDILPQRNSYHVNERSRIID